MTYRALAIDYDGTLAHDGIVDQATIDALHRARAHGLRLVMVTGRELQDLFNTFAHSELFDWIVAENGAVIYEPPTRTYKTLAPPPPSALLEALERHRVPISVGHSIIATVRPFEQQVLAAIRDLGLEWHVIFNKGAVMALPSDITKATGLAAVLHLLGLKHDIVGIGDAENDQAFLRLCGLSAAVANALSAVKDVADVVTAGSDGAGVRELIDRLISGELDAIVPNEKRHVPAI